MNIIIIMIPLSFLILIGALLAFFWAVNHDQFEDLDSPALLPMSDDLEQDGSKITHSKNPLVTKNN